MAYDVEICVPIAGGILGDHAVYARELEGGAMATSVHKGPYQEIAPAYHAVTSWIAQCGHDIAGPAREICLNDPQIVALGELRTRIEFPICSETG